MNVLCCYNTKDEWMDGWNIVKECLQDGRVKLCVATILMMDGWIDG